jgi:DNA-binding XRE family transcriptional regulator
MVLLDEAEYERLRLSASDALPPLPAPLSNGHYPAMEYARASLARKIIRDRVKRGLTREALAKLARIRVETLARAESGKYSTSVTTIDKIDRALVRALKRKK